MPKNLIYHPELQREATYEEIATHLNITTGTLRNRLCLWGSTPEGRHKAITQRGNTGSKLAAKPLAGIVKDTVVQIPVELDKRCQKYFSEQNEVKHLTRLIPRAIAAYDPSSTHNINIDKNYDGKIIRVKLTEENYRKVQSIIYPGKITHFKDAIAVILHCYLERWENGERFEEGDRRSESVAVVSASAASIVARRLINIKKSWL